MALLLRRCTWTSPCAPAPGSSACATAVGGIAVTQNTERHVIFGTKTVEEKKTALPGNEWHLFAVFRDRVL